MILQEGVKADAIFSGDGVYRWRLERWWAEERNPENWVAWVMLNPSTATAETDDPTVRRCQGFTRRWGFDGIVVVNLFALRSSTPKALYDHPAPVGVLNDAALQAVAEESEMVVAAWGNHGVYRGRGQEVRRLMEPLTFFTALGWTKDGHPIHPQARGKHRVPDDAQARAW